MYECFVCTYSCALCSYLVPVEDFEYSGTGDKVIYQSPSENSFVKEGGTIKLMLN